MIGRKSFTPAEFKLDEQGSVTVAFAQLGVVDSDMDVTLPGAFPTKAVPMSAYGHTSWDGALPIGRGSISEKAGWGVFDGQFLMETDQGRNGYHTVKAMADLQEWSYGYKPTDFSHGQQDGKSVRFLKALDVFEVSPVLKGAGLGTHTLAIKSGAPEPDAPYAEQLAWYSGWLPTFIDRVKAHKATRDGEGRKLSRTDRALLEDLDAALNGHIEVIRDLLIVPEPPKAAERRATEIEVLVAQAHLYGVPI